MINQVGSEVQMNGVSIEKKVKLIIESLLKQNIKKEDALQELIKYKRFGAVIKAEVQSFLQNPEVQKLPQCQEIYKVLNILQKKENEIFEPLFGGILAARKLQSQITKLVSKQTRLDELVRWLIKYKKYAEVFSQEFERILEEKEFKEGEGYNCVINLITATMKEDHSFTFLKPIKAGARIQELIKGMIKGKIPRTDVYNKLVKKKQYGPLIAKKILSLSYEDKITEENSFPEVLNLIDQLCKVEPDFVSSFEPIIVKIFKRVYKSVKQNKKSIQPLRIIRGSWFGLFSRENLDKIKTTIRLVFQDEIHKFTKEDIQNLRQFYESKKVEGYEEYLAVKPTTGVAPTNQIKQKKLASKQIALQNSEAEPLIAKKSKDPANLLQTKKTGTKEKTGNKEKRSTQDIEPALVKRPKKTETAQVQKVTAQVPTKIKVETIPPPVSVPPPITYHPRINEQVQVQQQKQQQQQQQPMQFYGHQPMMTIPPPQQMHVIQSVKKFLQNQFYNYKQMWQPEYKSVFLDLFANNVMGDQKEILEFKMNRESIQNFIKRNDHTSRDLNLNYSHKCQLCQMRFNSENRYIEHIEKHTKERLAQLNTLEKGNFQDLSLNLEDWLRGGTRTHGDFKEEEIFITIPYDRLKQSTCSVCTQKFICTWEGGLMIAQNVVNVRVHSDSQHNESLSLHLDCFKALQFQELPMSYNINPLQPNLTQYIYSDGQRNDHHFGR